MNARMMLELVGRYAPEDVKEQLHLIEQLEGQARSMQGKARAALHELAYGQCGGCPKCGYGKFSRLLKPSNGVDTTYEQMVAEDKRPTIVLPGEKY